MIDKINRISELNSDQPVQPKQQKPKDAKETPSFLFNPKDQLDIKNPFSRVIQPFNLFEPDLKTEKTATAEKKNEWSQPVQKLIEAGKKYGVGFTAGEDLENFQNKVIKAIIRAKAKELKIPENIALGIAGHESGWMMWQNIDEKKPSLVSGKNIIEKDNKQVLLSTDWGIMQVNDKAHTKAFPRAKNDLEYNIEFGLRFLADVRKEYKGSLGLGLGTWDKTIAAYNLGHSPDGKNELKIAKGYVSSVKKMAGKA